MRIALTGGATGIGAELVKLYKSDGHEVVAFDISEPEGADLWIETDMSDPDSIDAALAAAKGPFDVLLNNAGLPPRDGLEVKILEVNFFGMRRFLDGMLGQLKKGGRIVNTASRAGAMWRDNLDQIRALMAHDPDDAAGFIAAQGIDATRAYNLSKEAVIVMTLARTEEMLGKELRMNAVSPAAVSTGILKDFETAFGPKVAANIARVGRPGLPEEVANVIVFLASSESNWIRGQDVPIDGGMGALAVTDMLGLNR